MLSQFIRDSASHTVALTWGGAAFVPGADWALIFTAKSSLADEDEDAVFQKASGAGIEVTGSTATITTVPDDTDGLTSTNLHYDVQAQHVSTGEIRTVAIGLLRLQMDVTRLTQTSVPVFTTEEPVPFATPVTAAAIVAALNLPSYASLALANANQPIGTPFWNSVAEELQITTA